MSEEEAIEHDIYSGNPEDLVKPIAEPQDGENPSFTKKGPGRKPATTSAERRKLRLIRRPGVQPVTVSPSRRHKYLHAFARRKAARATQIAASSRIEAEELTRQAGQQPASSDTSSE